MRTFRKSTICTFVLASFALLGCPSDDSDADGDDDDDTTGDDTNTMTDPSNTMTDPSNTMTEPDTSATEPDTSATEPDTSATDSSSTTVDPEMFQFNPTPPDMYTRVDRKGFPAVSTGLHIGGDKDAYNAADPVTDVGDYFEDSTDEAAASLRLLHWGPDDDPDSEPSGLEDDLEGFGLEPCGNAFGLDQCVDQGSGALVYPDTLKINTTVDAGWNIDTSCAPIANGRRLSDPVIDIILAAIMLDLGAEPPPGFGVPCPDNPDGLFSAASTFLAIPDGAGGTFSLNPGANDVAFDEGFPYLAAPH
jgi:hypothetical protein